MHRLIHFEILVCLLVSLTGCGRSNIETAAKPSPVKLEIEPLEEVDDIENVLKLTDRIYSGGEPASALAMSQLRELGIKHIISVDGAKPNVQLAADYGMQYVHVPIGYDGISEDAGAALAKAVRELDGPIFIHCHHGKHRGPAAAAVCAIAETGINSDQATEILKMAGTSPDYAGLWKDVAAYVPPKNTDDLPPLVETAMVDSFTAAMASVGRSHDHLKMLKAANWQRLDDHPDLVANQEALILSEGFRETLRFIEQSNPYDREFETQIRDNLALSEQLEMSLIAGDINTAERCFATIQSNCKQCHKAYRD